MSEAAAGTNPGGSGIESFFEGIAPSEGTGTGTTTQTGTTQTGSTGSTETQTGTTDTTGTTGTGGTQPQTAPVTTTPPVTTAPPVATPPVEGTLALTAEQLATVISSVQNGTKPAETVKEPTQAELDEKFSVVRPNEEVLNTIFRGGVEGVKALETTLHATARMGATIASHHLVGELKKLQEWTAKQLEGLRPAREVAERQQLEQHKTTFFSKFPHWTKQHEPLLKAVHDKLVQDKFQGTPEQVYQKINDEAVALTRTINPNFAITAAGTGATQTGTGNPNPQQQTALPPSQMTALPVGGANGSGAPSGSSSGAKNGPEAIFG